ncbi:pseudaminic acid cytidylyltransferase [Alteromonas hispanica]|uniref:Pseudaminic acid cytidylyltransferase n=1 Tax=Alteromonas hispanica TaxID=315421 RepID=A0A6L9MQZ5_9ALTE|nr:pseudaminic acid cytidylyltransferase [Alteromonas hispanica]NDW20664.1 pseudaminic acid cytidylyltransferase [Alteromonas hispanica]
MNIAIIPARGGSKRIPRKNIKPFCGKPMIAHAIDNALRSEHIQRVVVSTDDEEIANIAIEYGADVPFMRPAALADDYTGTAPVVRHAISMLLEDGWTLDNCACIYATSPLLSSQLIDTCIEKLKKSDDLEYVFTAARFSFPIQRALLQMPDGGVTAFDKIAITKRSQDLETTYHDAGQLYCGHYSRWLDEKSQVFGLQSRMVVLPDHLVQDIDTEADWKRAELLYKLLQT